jgi:hypothetical protein
MKMMKRSDLLLVIRWPHHTGTILNPILGGAHHFKVPHDVRIRLPRKDEIGVGEKEKPLKLLLSLRFAHDYSHRRERDGVVPLDPTPKNYQNKYI